MLSSFEIKAANFTTASGGTKARYAAYGQAECFRTTERTVSYDTNSDFVPR